MPDKKLLDQLRQEKEQAEAQLAQAQRRLTRLENRKQYYPTVIQSWLLILNDLSAADWFLKGRKR